MDRDPTRPSVLKPEVPKNEEERKIIGELIPLLKTIPEDEQESNQRLNELVAETWKYLENHKEEVPRIANIMLDHGLGEFVTSSVKMTFSPDFDEATILRIVREGLDKNFARHGWMYPQIKDPDAFANACMDGGFYRDFALSLRDYWGVSDPVNHPNLEFGLSVARENGSLTKPLSVSVAKRLLAFAEKPEADSTEGNAGQIRRLFINNIPKFTGLDGEVAEVLTRHLLDDVKFVKQNPQYFEGLTKENIDENIGKWLVAQGSPYRFFKVVEAAELSIPNQFFYEVAKLWKDKTLSPEEYELLREKNKEFTPPLVPELQEFFALAGNFASHKLYTMFREGMVDEAKLSEASVKVRTFIEAAHDPEDQEAKRVLREIMEDPLRFELFKSYLRIENSAWGVHGDSETKKTIERYLQNAETYKMLPEDLMPDTLIVSKVDRKKGQENGYTPEFKERWPVIVKALTAAEACLNLGKFPLLSDWKHEFKKILGELIAEREENVKKQAGNPKALAHAEKMLEQARSVSLSDLENTFTTLFDAKKTKDLNRVFLVFGFVVAMRRNNMLVTLSEDGFSNPTTQDISTVLDFVTHVAHQETWEKSGRFADKKAREKLGELFHVKALEDQIEKMQKEVRVSKETSAIRVVPSRDILTEFSGHMGDACWASRYEILDRPNISSLSFFVDGKVAGSCLLIEEYADGKHWMIIRGLNPLESVINKLDQESFVQALVEYLQKIADKRNSAYPERVEEIGEDRVAIVIDDHAGGSSTNRPLLFNYLNGLKRALKKVPLSITNKQNTTFNDYDITKATYEISPSVFVNE